jgi:hypothetical protein
MYFKKGSGGRGERWPKQCIHVNKCKNNKKEKRKKNNSKPKDTSTKMVYW